MKDFLDQCKKTLLGYEKQDTQDVSNVMERVDAQIGRAVTRLADR